MTVIRSRNTNISSTERKVINTSKPAITKDLESKERTEVCTQNGKDVECPKSNKPLKTSVTKESSGPKWLKYTVYFLFFAGFLVGLYFMVKKFGNKNKNKNLNSLFK